MHNNFTHWKSITTQKRNGTETKVKTISHDKQSQQHQDRTKSGAKNWNEEMDIQQDYI